MKKFIMLAAFISIGLMALGQNADEENIKKAIEAEYSAFNSNLDAWKATWLHDAKVFFASYAHTGYQTIMSWDSVAAQGERDFKINSIHNDSTKLKDSARSKNENYNIRTDGNMAWVEFERVFTPINIQPDIFPYSGSGVARYHHYEALVKENNQWKITSEIITDPESYTLNADHEIEFDLNNTGYYLLNAKKINDAIEVFKMNVKLFPNSWNTYDSLGDAFAAAGNKKLAIENYEHSLKLNPKNEEGAQKMAKLK